MRKSSRSLPLKRALALTVAAFVCLGATGASAAAGEPAEPWAYVNHGDGAAPEAAEVFATVDESDGVVSPLVFLDPFETLQCRSGNRDFPVHTYFDYFQFHHVEMLCGHHNETTGSGSGWNHIEARHYEEWQQLLDECRAKRGCLDPTIQWDDVMNIAVVGALEAQLYNERRSNNQTYCYGTEMWLNSDPMIVVRPSVVVSYNRAGTIVDPQTIVTAWPSRTNPC